MGVIMWGRWLILLFILGCAETEKDPMSPVDDSVVPMLDSGETVDGMSPPLTDVDSAPVSLDGATVSDGFIVDADLPPLEPDAASQTVLCEAIDNNPNWQVCDAEPNRCIALFEDGAGCDAVCAAAGLRCVESYENIDGECAPDRTRPALNCVDGHSSDVCVCQRGECVPDCAGRSCGSDGCGGLCGRCNDVDICRDGTCVVAPEIRCSPEDCPAFPGAEGEGRNARGGRGGDVCRVTSLASDGAGTLRRCLTSVDGPRTVVFAVAGYIDLDSTLRVQASNITIAGQTAPGEGITLRDWGVVINGDHIIIQHLRFRAGDREKATRNREGFTEDSLSITGNDIMVDHVSASWGIDENLSSGPGPFRRTTVQYSIISEGLHRTRLFHGEYDEDHPGHSMGGLYKSREGNSTISLHHNLFAHNNNRNPAVGNYSDEDTFDADIRNNVIYDCRNMGYVSGDSERVRINYVGNYGIFGPASRSDDLFRGNEDANVKIYQTGNRVDTNRNRRFDGVDRGWSMFGDEYDRMNEAVSLQPVTTQTAEEALQTVLEHAGARPWGRDRTDQRVVANVRSGTGGLIDSQSEVGGWGDLARGEAPEDRDRDGMPDAWEQRHGSDPERVDHNGDVDGDGYTNLENYLHWAARLEDRDSQ